MESTTSDSTGSPSEIDAKSMQKSMTIWDGDRHAFLHHFADIGKYQKMNIFEQVLP